MREGDLVKLTKRDSFEISQIFPPIVDWEVTSRCNLTCRFCFGALPELFDGKELSTTQMLAIADKLSTAGVRRVVITGGEPLLRKDIVDLLEHLKNFGVQIVLSTNGYYLERKISSIAPLLEWVAVPIDGSVPSISEAMRGDPQHYLLTLQNIKLLNQYRLRIKVGTVVCKLNQDDLMNIAHLLHGLHFDTWKLYQFSPRDRGRVFRKELEIPQEIYFEVCREVVKQYPDMNIIVSPLESRNSAYFLILPNGSVVTPNDDSYSEIVNLLEPDIELDAWRTKIDQAKMIRNFQSTYPARSTRQQ